MLYNHVVRALLCAAVCACYSPSYRDCTIACETTCPSGLSCDIASHLCTIGTTCTNGYDAKPPPCWMYSPYNYAPCDPGFRGTEPPQQSGTLDTDMTSLGEMYTFGGATVRLIHVASFTMASTDTAKMRATASIAPRIARALGTAGVAIS